MKPMRFERHSPGKPAFLSVGGSEEWVILPQKAIPVIESLIELEKEVMNLNKDLVYLRDWTTSFGDNEKESELVLKFEAARGEINNRIRSLVRNALPSACDPHMIKLKGWLADPEIDWTSLPSSVKDCLDAFGKRD
ncbi:hypothetical protein ACFL1X_13330 [Candidatus Hydrogenedentota bacterium]